MIDFSQAYGSALLSEAVYALNKNKDGYFIGGSSLKNLFNEPLKESEFISYICDNYVLVDAIEGSSGLEAALWQDKSSKELFLSIEGTTAVSLPGMGDSALDLAADADISTTGMARNQIVDLANWWLRLCTPEGSLAPQIKSISPFPNVAYFQQSTPVEGIGLVDPLTNEGILNGDIVVSGHSLGGFLASTFTRLFGGEFNISHTYTFNAPGFTGLSELAFNSLHAAIGNQYGLIDPATGQNRYPTDEEQTNIVAKHGTDFVANDWFFLHYGSRTLTEHEHSSNSASHGIYKLVDSLAIGALVHEVDEGFLHSEFNELISRGSLTHVDTLESLIHSFQKLFSSESPTPLNPNDSPLLEHRDPYHEALHALRDDMAPWKDKLSIELYLYNLSYLAQTDFSAFVTLKQLLPFYAKGVTPNDVSLFTNHLSSQYEQDHQLWAQDMAAYAPGMYTLDWLRDRNALLEDTMNGRAADDSSSDFTSVSLVPEKGVMVEYYLSESDPAKGSISRVLNRDVRIDWETITIVPLDPVKLLKFGSNDNDNIIVPYHYTSGGRVYGEDGDDTLFGFDYNDLLHGGFGNDILMGGKGDDHLIGGPGQDIYIYRAGDGNDTIAAFDPFDPKSDTLLLVDILPEEVSMYSDGYDRVIRFDMGGSVTVLQWHRGEEYKLNISYQNTSTSTQSEEMLASFQSETEGLGLIEGQLPSIDLIASITAYDEHYGVLV